MKTATKKPPIRFMIRRDMAQILTIENASFETPWCEEDFLKVLRQRSCLGMVWERCDRIMGYVVYELHDSHLEILNIAVDPEQRRQKIGTDMIWALVEKCGTLRRFVTCKVHEANLNGQLFLKAQGFLATNVIRGHYSDGCDAYEMELYP